MGKKKAGTEETKGKVYQADFSIQRGLAPELEFTKTVIEEPC